MRLLMEAEGREEVHCVEGAGSDGGRCYCCCIFRGWGEWAVTERLHVEHLSASRMLEREVGLS